MYAGTPPLEALRYILSHAASFHPDKEMDRRNVLVSDVSRTYFNVVVTRDIYIELLPEDHRGGLGMIGKLNVCLYGTRNAALDWQNLV